MKCTALCKIMVSVTDVVSDDCDNLSESIFSDGCESNIASNGKSDEDLVITFVRFLFNL